MDALSPTELLTQLRTHRWVDLTHAFGPGIPHYHAFPDEERTTLFHFDEGVGTDGSGFLAHRYSHIGQWGTHCDPPAHFTRGGRFLDELPVTEMVLPLVVLDLRAQAAADVDHAVTPEDVTAHEAEHGRIPDGAFVAARWGWDARWPDGEAMAGRGDDGLAHFPGWGVDALRLLVEERGVVAIGHDTTDTDPGAVVSAGTAPAETYVLGADRWQIELLANLGDVPATGAIVVATWPKPEEGSGFPARVFAIAPNG
ncbi:cyclase family protein [Patulibacter sp.]|uniref:cyclase family protein n=1 Tax=Patulibacter sp. TaxID=1912859 RepID=UPI00271C9ACD|nr:cyclase family protein [Patulibacter sp.]MDO9409409.1 cyclase family protein [Patulibacter sp.]